MKKLFQALSLAIAAALTWPWPATAQQSGCAPRDIVIERLANRYGESRQAIGLGSSSAVVEVFASLETGTWTITVTGPDGTTCLVAAGQAFEALAEAPLTKGSDA